LINTIYGVKIDREKKVYFSYGFNGHEIEYFASPIEGMEEKNKNTYTIYTEQHGNEMNQTTETIFFEANRFKSSYVFREIYKDLDDKAIYITTKGIIKTIYGGKRIASNPQRIVSKPTKFIKNLDK